MAISITDKTIAEAFDELKNKDSINWLLCQYDSTGKALEFHSKGTKGLGEILDNFKDDIILYGVYKVIAVDDDSKRTKFIQITWVGPNVKPMVRAKVSTHKSVVISYFKGSHVEVHYGSTNDISKDDLAKRLTTSTGSHKPKAYDWGDGEVTEVVKE